MIGDRDRDGGHRFPRGRREPLTDERVRDALARLRFHADPEACPREYRARVPLAERKLRELLEESGAVATAYPGLSPNHPLHWEPDDPADPYR